VNCARDYNLTSALITISNLMEKKQKKNLAGSEKNLLSSPVLASVNVPAALCRKLVSLEEMAMV
jgi:hypothetical protein